MNLFIIMEEVLLAALMAVAVEEGVAEVAGEVHHMDIIIITG